MWRAIVNFGYHRRDPSGWTPELSLLARVVTEVGGLLSHDAVVARKYGLPAVAGVIGATAVISSGDNILLDGDQGMVTKVGVRARGDGATGAQ